MGQYYILVNVDKKEYCRAHDLGGMAKLGEWCTCPQSLVFPYLTALCDGSGGGDPDTSQPLKFLGRWAGDRIVLVGDYWGSNDESLPYAGLYRHVYEQNVDNIKETIASLKKSIKSLRTRGGECYMNSPEDREKFAKEKEQRLVEEKKHLAELQKKDKSELYTNISAELKTEFESLYGKDALDWTKSPFIHGVGMPDMVLGYSPRTKKKLTP